MEPIKTHDEVLIEKVLRAVKAEKFQPLPIELRRKAMLAMADLIEELAPRSGFTPSDMVSVREVCDDLREAARRIA